jgi:hypothetical protein
MRESESLLSLGYRRIILAGLMVLSGLFCWESDAEAQTIHRKDLSLFRCRVDRSKRLPNDERLPSTVRILDSTCLTNSNFDTLLSDGRRWSFTHPSDAFAITMYLDTSNSNAYGRMIGKRVSFYLMHDVGGYGGSSSLLTTWELIEPDSMKLVCAQEGYFGGGYSHSRIMLQSIFPDGSILLIIYSSGGDGGDFDRGFSFYRGNSPCEFRRFYSGGYDQDSDLWVSFDLTTFFYNTTTIVETTVYANTKLDSTGLFDAHPDSTSSRIINLWEIAKDSFNIKE